MSLEIFILVYLARWLHILSATLAIGVPIYMRLVLIPGLEILDEDNRSRLREKLARRWSRIVYMLIAVFLATGFFNFLGPHAHWRTFRETAPEKIFQYHLIFGIKLFLALVMFFISSALAGRSQAFVKLRSNAKVWTTGLIILGLIVLGLSVVLRFM